MQPAWPAAARPLRRNSVLEADDGSMQKARLEIGKGLYQTNGSYC